MFCLKPDFSVASVGCIQHLSERIKLFLDVFKYNQQSVYLYANK